jgi:hypothetical protein
MATKHWVHDVLLTDTQDYIAGGNHNRANALLFHFLRVAGPTGWEWLWECDGEVGTHALNPNHVQDGNVQAVDAALFSQYGSCTLSKETVGVVTGVRRLKAVVGAAGNGFTTAALLAMTAPTVTATANGDTLSGPTNGFMTLTRGSTYFDHEHSNQQITISGSVRPSNNGSFRILKQGGPDDDNLTKLVFYNPAGIAESYSSIYTVAYRIQRRYELVVLASNGGPAWDVQVDPGTGVFASVGSLLPTGGGAAELQRFTFYVNGSGSCYVRLVASGAGTLYVEGMSAHRSLFEGWIWAAGEATGVIAAPDRFSVSSGFICDGGVVGMHLFVWDATNPKNSGCYEIAGDAGGGQVTLNLRSSTKVLVAATGLRWRIVHIRSVPNSTMPLWQQSAGFGVESPHASKWRFFLRQNQTSAQASKNSQLWAAPEDTDFDFSNGHFYLTGASCMRNRCATWTRNVSGGGNTPLMHTWRGHYTYGTADTKSRVFVMTDEDCSFFAFAVMDADGTHEHGAFTVGFTRTDLPAWLDSAEETFAILAQWEVLSSVSALYFDAAATRFGYSGTGFGGDGLACELSIAQLGLGLGTSDDYEPELYSLAKANPIDGTEWMRPFIVMRDPVGAVGQSSYWQSDFGQHQGRANMAEILTFDANAFLHLGYGVIWEWDGEALAP